LDEIDFQILKILNKNCRISLSKISRGLGLSVRTISRRINLLIDNHIIRYFTVNFSFERLGYRNYIGSLNPPKENHSINFFKELQFIPEIYQMWELLDGSIVFSIFSENSAHLEKIITKLLETGAKLNSYVEPRSHLSLDYPFSNMDWRIICYLFKDSRAPKQKIAIDLGINEKTVARRLKRMRTMNLVQFTLILDWSNVKGMIPAVISLETIGPSKPIYFKLKEDSKIKYWRNVGDVSPTIILFVYAQNLTELYEMCEILRRREDIKECTLRFEVRFYENSNIIADAILQKIQ